MEMVTVVPRQRLEGLELLGGPTEAMVPPRRCMLPFWLALLLKRQRRVNILAPSWLALESLSSILEIETRQTEQFCRPPTLLSPAQDGNTGARQQNRSHRTPRHRYDMDGKKYTPTPPFLLQNTVDVDQIEEIQQSLPYHWLELATMLLDVASDDIQDSDQVRRCIRDLREVRMSKMRHLMEGLDATAVGGGDGLKLTGVGAMEIGEARGFIAGAAEALRQLGASKEEALRDQTTEEGGGEGEDLQFGGKNDYDDDMDLEL
ncbi:DNA replication complex GINS protein PSF2 [Arthroderma uncinatum]|uniref:DNA replication complex GINS protein PSF2 n=1 Tax=Arthroderma uncinatum TaxID=74035 RepID=UPI00144A9B2D|nr:DNA replication complex GINS protein PSF2 [Arthroderma uncinatum]KAF3482924.1 DNA replication complex GINS protein PSF2 [Arthroderma uncinatum]